MSRVWLSSPHMGGNETVYVNEAFQSNWVAPLGPNVEAFEKQIAQRLTVSDAHALSSGTAAIHLALVVLGVKPGDSVLCQSFTFAASAFPINYLGAHPVFVDSEKDTWNMDPALLEEAIIAETKKGKKPSAIIIVHLYGVPAKMDELMAVANKYEIPVIEDAAEALGSTYKNKPCGSFGTLGILSFNGNKIITTSGGGALVSNDKELIAKARNLSAQAREPVPYYLHTQIGYNYRLSNICAGIGRGQMEVLDERIKRRQNIYNYYKTEFSKINGITFANEQNDVVCNRWLTTILFDSGYPDVNETFRLKLEESNIESRALWKPLHQQPVYKNTVSYTNGVSDDLYARGLCLPSGSNLSDEVIKIVVSKFNSIAYEVLR